MEAVVAQGTSVGRRSCVNSTSTRALTSARFTRRATSKHRGRSAVKTQTLYESHRFRAVTENSAETIEADSTTIDWFKQWWPVYVEENLHTDRPNRIQLLEEYFVVWKKPGGEWVTMKDACPHRLAPLSEGRIEDDGTLMCSYHGWRFNECGKCVKIPQADDEKSHQVACDSPRSAAKTFPCKTAVGLLWIWPDDSSTAFEESAAKPLIIPDEFLAAAEELGGQLKYVLFSRILPFSVEILMENLRDPAHFMFSHHGILGRRENGGPIDMCPADPYFPNSIAAVRYGKEKSSNRFPTSEMLGPGCLYNLSPGFRENGFGFLSVLFATPIDKHNSKFMSMFFSTESFYSNSKRWKQPLIQRLFPWVLHMVMLRVLDGDNIFLHLQDKYIHQKKGDWKQSWYYTPTKSDQYVNSYREWLMTEGGGGPTYRESKEIPTLTRRQLLDRYDSHVADCDICQRGLRFVRRMKAVSVWLSRISALATAVLMFLFSEGKLPVWKALLPAIPFLLFGWIANRIEKKIIPLFYFIDYVHQDIL